MVYLLSAINQKPLLRQQGRQYRLYTSCSYENDITASVLIAIPKKRDKK